MKTVLEKQTRDGLIDRINTLNENSKPQWGKMNIYQAIKHCTLWDEWIFGKTSYRQLLVGRLFGKMALRNVLKDDKPLSRNSPTISAFRIGGTDGDVEAEKTKWIALIEQYENFSNPGFVHPFFGRMTREQIGFLAYKHIDHHLRQFGS
jgi:hypothetical protein